MIANAWWLAAGIAALLVNALHIWLGGREIARRLIDAPSLHPVVKWTTYYCWHMATIAMLVMGALFVAAGMQAEHATFAIPATALALGFCALSVGIVVAARQSALEMPQWGLFAVVTALGLMGFAG